jgi:anti-sigma regulatory factor (Ser/Thr protein kinase)
VTDFLAREPAVSGVSPDIVLVVSELVTNAMRHGDGDIVALGSFGADEVRVAITDSGEALPVVLPTTTGQIGGLGLHVVGQVADAWGVAPFPGGKTVWATFRLGPA